MYRHGLVCLARIPPVSPAACVCHSLTCTIIFVFILMHTDVCIYAKIYIRTLYMYEYMYMNMYIYIYINMNIYIYIYMCAYIFICRALLQWGTLVCDALAERQRDDLGHSHLRPFGWCPGLLCRYLGLFCTYLGLFGGYIGLFCSDLPLCVTHW